MKWITKRKIKKEKKTIFVVGASKGLGVTHTCLCLANYLHSVEGRKVMYLEVCKNSSLFEMVEKKQVIVDGVKAYKYMGVYYVLSCSVREAEEIIKSTDVDIVIDVEDYRGDIKNLMLLSNKKIVVASMQAWQKDNLINALRHFTNLIDIKMLVIANKDKRKNKKSEVSNLTLKPIPQIDNPFKLDERDFPALGELLA
ncbi:MAG: hypothetical protein K5773_09100 [Pseudobutyrivibrio sp.]|nr:hypothetical protein [Pseudobutyrivibrio sp.]